MAKCIDKCLFCNGQNSRAEEIEAWIREQTEFFAGRLKYKRDLELELQREAREVVYLKKENLQVERDIAELQKLTESIRAFQKAPRNSSEDLQTAKVNEMIELIRACWAPAKFRWRHVKNRRNTTDLQKMIEEIEGKQKGLQVMLEMAQSKLTQQKVVKEVKKLKLQTPRRRKSLPSRARSSSSSSLSTEFFLSLDSLD